MRCQTCDHTMENVGTNCGHQVFWCPRCGSIKYGDNEYANSAPRIVSRASRTIAALDVFLSDKAFLEAIYELPDMNVALDVESLRECLPERLNDEMLQTENGKTL